MISALVNNKGLSAGEAFVIIISEGFFHTTLEAKENESSILIFRFRGGIFLKKMTLLRSLLKEPGNLIVPTAYDCFSAILQEKILARTETSIRSTKITDTRTTVESTHIPDGINIRDKWAIRKEAM